MASEGITGASIEVILKLYHVNSKNDILALIHIYINELWNWEGSDISDDAGADANTDAQSLKELPNTRKSGEVSF